MMPYLRIGNLKTSTLFRGTYLYRQYWEYPPLPPPPKRAACNEALFQYIFSGYRPALHGGRPALPSSPRYQPQGYNYRESRSCTDYCCLACDSDYEWYKLEGKGNNL